MNEVADTKSRILDAAGALFAERGIDAASLRDIAAAARVNLAAANYHFGSKDNLVRAVAARLLAPIGQRRLALLDAAEAGGFNGVETVLDAFLRPLLEDYSPLMMRLLMENPERAQVLFLDQARETIQRFDQAFARACPHLDFAARHWAMHFLAGSAMFTLAGAHILTAHSRGKCSVKDTEALIQRLIAHHAPAFRPPASKRAGREKKWTLTRR